MRLFSQHLDVKFDQKFAAFKRDLEDEEAATQSELKKLKTESKASNSFTIKGNKEQYELNICLHDLGGVYMRKLAPARVSHWDDFLISYRVYMMTGSFHILLFNGTFHVDKIHVWFKIANITHALPRSSLPADRFHTEMGGRFAFT